jgi:hypothetical protein
VLYCCLPIFNCMVRTSCHANDQAKLLTIVLEFNGVFAMKYFFKSEKKIDLSIDTYRAIIIFWCMMNAFIFLYEICT